MEADMMKVYNYDDDGRLIGEYMLDDSDKCPITGGWLIPGRATDKIPLDPKEGHTVLFKSGEWVYEKILTEDDMKIAGRIPLAEGEILQNGALVRLERPDRVHSWDGAKWVFDNDLFANEKRDAYNRLKMARDAACEEGFMLEMIL